VLRLEQGSQDDGLSELLHHWMTPNIAEWLGDPFVVIGGAGEGWGVTRGVWGAQRCRSFAMELKTKK
jgi:hypothetical protein